MNIVSTFMHIKDAFNQGASIKISSILVNTEAAAAALYGLFSAVVLVLKDFGIPITIGGSDLHTMANGWAITLSLVYAVYRVITNPDAGVKSKE